MANDKHNNPLIDAFLKLQSGSKINEVTDTEIMNSDLYKNAVKSVKDPTKIQVGQEVTGLGKFGKGDTIWSKVKGELEKQKAAPAPTELPKGPAGSPNYTGGGSLGAFKPGENFQRDLLTAQDEGKKKAAAAAPSYTNIKPPGPNVTATTPQQRLGTGLGGGIDPVYNNPDVGSDGNPLPKTNLSWGDIGKDALRYAAAETIAKVGSSKLDRYSVPTKGGNYTAEETNPLIDTFMKLQNDKSGNMFEAAKKLKEDTPPVPAEMTPALKAKRNQTTFDKMYPSDVGKLYNIGTMYPGTPQAYQATGAPMLQQTKLYAKDIADKTAKDPNWNTEKPAADFIGRAKVARDSSMDTFTPGMKNPEDLTTALGQYANRRYIADVQKQNPIGGLVRQLPFFGVKYEEFSDAELTHFAAIMEANMLHIKVGEKVRLSNPKAEPKHTVTKIEGDRAHITKADGNKVVMPLDRIKRVKYAASKGLPSALGLNKEEYEQIDEAEPVAPTPDDYSGSKNGPSVRTLTDETKWGKKKKVSEGLEIARKSTGPSLGDIVSNLGRKSPEAPAPDSLGSAPVDTVRNINATVNDSPEANMAGRGLPTGGVIRSSNGPTAKLTPPNPMDKMKGRGLPNTISRTGVSEEAEEVNEVLGDVDSTKRGAKAGLKNAGGKTPSWLTNAINKRKGQLDPVGQEDADIDNDGVPNTKTDKYLKHRRDVISANINKEEFEQIEEGRGKGSGRGRPAGSKSGSKYGEGGEGGSTSHIIDQIKYAEERGIADGKGNYKLKHPVSGETRAVPQKAANDFYRDYMNTAKPADKNTKYSSFLGKHFGDSRATEDAPLEKMSPSEREKRIYLGKK